MTDIGINPHQIEAFSFALSSLELGRAILSDEVGFGKNIEAGLVVKYLLCSGKNKILLTATPMQNTLLDMYGLVHYIDDKIFYSKYVFLERYLSSEDFEDLKICLEPVVQRTLRKEVAEYIQFSERKEMTIDFELSPMEIELYVMINNYLRKETLYALPNSHRTLITSVIRKLLASSSMAVAEPFKVLKGRFEVLKETTRTELADESIDFFFSFLMMMK